MHGNGTDWDLMGSMGFPVEWEYDQPWDGNGIRRVGMGIKTWEWEKIKRLRLYPIFAHSISLRDTKFHMPLHDYHSFELIFIF